MKKYMCAILLSAVHLFVFKAGVNAQCSIENQFFDSGEKLTYDLYIKLGFTVKGGYASLNTRSTKYKGKEAYKMSLISESQGFARKVFPLNDTLACYMSKDLVPLAYLKDAHEGNDHTIERLTYSYPKNKVNIRTVRHKNGNFKFDKTLSFLGCTYDMMSILFYTRTLDYKGMKKGDEKTVNFVSGKSPVSMKIVYNGKEKVKANDKKKYNCVKLTLYIQDEAFDNGKEAMKVFISDDDNRLPIHLETKLKVGSTKVVLKSYKGNKHPVNVVK